ncbi:MAG: hypothetical protein ACOZJX_01820 [Pseudomonadota bacterium]
MDDSSSPSSGTGGLQEVIITLPRPLVATLALLLLAGAVASGWLAVQAEAESLRDVAKSVLLVLLPMMVVVAAAIGVRRTSTTQVDELVTAFIEKTVLARFELACTQRTFHEFPFTAVRLAQPTGGRSYAGFDFDWADEARRGEPARVWVKMNVLNFEVIVDQALRWPTPVDAQADLPSAFFDGDNLDTVLKHPVARHLAMTIQGSIEEDYKIRLLLEPGDDGAVLMHLSFRQKLRAHFLASPFLKRYYAEDAAILVGILFRELHKSPLLAPLAGEQRVTV